MKTIWNSIEKIQKEANKYTRRSDFAKQSPSAYNSAWKRGFLGSVCSHMERSQSEAYSLEELRMEALKYKTRGDFQKYSPSIYNCSWKRGVLDEICSHMEYIRTYWTDEELQTEAIKYKARVDFQKYSGRAYGAAWSRGQQFLDKICSHMKKSRSSSLQELELLGVIKFWYPEAKKFKDFKVKIEGKPYIYGFEIDILVGKRGIEFDGKRYHSYEYMRKDKRKDLWSDEDVRNYHKLKDDWFETKDIQIYHVKEEDWIADKEACVKRCLEFLSSA